VAPGPSNSNYKYRFERTYSVIYAQCGSAVGSLTRTVINKPESEVRVSELLLLGPGAAASGHWQPETVTRPGAMATAARKRRRVARGSGVGEWGRGRGRGGGRGGCVDARLDAGSRAPTGLSYASNIMA